MASAQGSAQQWRLLAVFAIVVGVVFGLVYFTGDKSPTPKLGIDLQGGTRVTLTARTPDGGAPSQDALKQAQEIIESRVNGLGVSGSEVVVDGQNIVITVPGADSSSARSLGQTAKLFIRPVLDVREAQQPQQQPGQQQPGQVVPGLPGQGQPGQVPSGQPGQVPSGQSGQVPAPQPRPFPEQNPPAPTPTSGAPAPTTGAPAPTSGAPAPTTPAKPLTAAEQAAAEIAEAKELRQNEANQQLAFMLMNCDQADPLRGNDDPKLPLVTCDDKKQYVYLLGPSLIDGQEISDARSAFDSQQSRHTVSLEFKSAASETWAKFTSENLGKQAAFTLDSQVLSAPQIQGATPAGSATQITGDFTAKEAKELANSLKYGSLPLSFTASEAETVSATLGLSSLRYGLVAGAVGLAIVVLYCLLYYRGLGVLITFSLFAAGVVVYGLLVLLGRWINFTLDLAGIAGLIIGIGMTADSFVVFFERIKDEMREGRSFRSAVPRGWGRAQRTNLSGKTVSLIASAVLYILAAGQVRGFAFTLGLTTVLDIIVLYLVTAPLMMMASRSPFWSRPSVNGLGAVAQIARERKAAAAASAKEVSA